MTKLGIDLGTTNTVLAVGRRALEGDGSPFLPSVVAYLPGGRQLVGAQARRRRTIDPRNTIYSSKRLIGRRWGSSDAKKFERRYPFELAPGPAGDVLFRTRAGDESPVDVAKAILATQMERTGIDPHTVEATLSVPSKFGEGERKATAEAANLAGIEHVRIIDEPIATAWAYLKNPAADVSRAVVYDLGGGTFDFAVVDCSRERFELIAHGGDLYLGGDDIDRAIAEWVTEEVLRAHKWDLRDDPNVWERLILECERAKVRCAYAGTAEVALSQIDPSAPFAGATISMEQSHIASLVSDLIQRTFVICDEVLHNAKTRFQDVGVVFLAGGSTQLPFVRDGVGAYFGRQPRSDYDPMEVIALGASVVADRG